ncbi:RNA-directed DNA polymerase, eukaryota, Reverse transcriptase zinc-binding domain protein [Artemisia annua]|uniref:RNA-directed DNA polymerase, eukaryota, Reverse transcriptase zinc-binding domain protein n=1 Tax=Artemisia annua TaxID=35608 RepID=A0A2U1PPI3_ARTAN|nr:RNA-directed DNA polymerase, eukaryota, Reverse transcriptase zinc-binding domain protein [Artemisia annua]
MMNFVNGSQESHNKEDEDCEDAENSKVGNGDVEENDSKTTEMNAGCTNSDAVGTNSDTPGTSSDAGDKVTGSKSSNASTSVLNSIESTNGKNKNSFAKVVGNSNVALDKKLCFVPTMTCDDGSEVVIFEEELVIEEANKNTYEGAKVVQNRGNGNNNIQAKARVQGMAGWNKFDKGNMNNRDAGWNKFDKGKSKEVYRPKSMYGQNGNDVNNKSNAGMNKSGQNGNNVKGSKSLGESSENEISVTQKKDVEYYIHNNLQPTPLEISKWTQDMERYFKEKWDEKFNNCDISEGEELKIASWNIRGIGTKDKQNEVKSLISGNRLSLCAVLEARAKGNDVERICRKIFGSWNWATNMSQCSKGCRIMMGWNADEINVQILSMDWQVVFCVIETVQQKVKFFCSIVYAANHGKERCSLWRSLKMQNCCDSIHHLFFQCHFTNKIWMVIKCELEMHDAPDEWVHLIQSMISDMDNNRITSVLGKIGVAACVYNIWRERNQRLF